MENIWRIAAAWMGLARSEKLVAADVSATAGGHKERSHLWSGWVSQARKWVVPVVRHKMVLLFVGGGLGTLARYLISKWFNEQPWGQGFPYGTFFINASGSFVLAAAAAVVILERLSPAHQGWYLLLGTGFCGGYTTFSTFEWETYKLARDASWWYALTPRPQAVRMSAGGGLLTYQKTGGVIAASLTGSTPFRSSLC